MELLKKRYIQILIAIAVGIAIGVIAYPSSRIEKTVKEEYSKKLEVASNLYNIHISHMEEQISSKSKELKSYEEQTKHTIVSFESQIKDLKSKTTEKTYKLIKPDGTIIEKTFKQSETEEHNEYVKNVREEFDKKISSIEEKWLDIHKTRIKEIRDEHKEILTKKLSEQKTRYEKTVIETNIKQYNVEFGMSTDTRQYIHTSYTLWGPISVGAHVAGNYDGSNLSGGLGLGISF